MGRKRKPKQQMLPFPNGWGGWRKGAGRKPVGKKAMHSHGARPNVAECYPLHVVYRLEKGLPGLRNYRTLDLLREVFVAACRKAGFRIVHWSVMSNHVHMICEASGKEELARGLQGLAIRMAKALNRFWGRKGRVFADRYHCTVLRSPTQVRHALVYVLHNAKKHRIKLPGSIDPYSTAAWFDGWKEPHDAEVAFRALQPVARARTKLLRTRWRRARGGLISKEEVPALRG